MYTPSEVRHLIWARHYGQGVVRPRAGGPSFVVGKVVGPIYLVDAYGGSERWFWGVSFQLTGRKSYGNDASLDEAKAAFKAEYAAWRATQ